MYIQKPFIINSYWSTTINFLLSPVIDNVIKIVSSILIKFMFYVPLYSFTLCVGNWTDSIVKYNLFALILLDNTEYLINVKRFFIYINYELQKKP